jgi:hypothetical protein
MNAILIGNTTNTLTAATKEESLKSFDENTVQTMDRMKQAIDILSKDKDYWDGFKDEAQGMTVFEHYDEFTEHYAKWLELANAAKNTYQVGADYSKIFDDAREHINSIGEIIDLGAQQAIAENNAEKDEMIISMLIIDAVVLVLILVLSVLLIRAITGPLKKSVAMLQDMVKGRLSRRLNLKQRDEIGVLGENLDLFADNLQNNVVGTMKKISEGKNIFDIWGGISSAQSTLNILLEEGFWKRGISLETIVKLMATNPAKRFGLYPAKGTISIGSDADFTIIDIDNCFTLQKKDLFYKHKMSPYIGKQFRGMVIYTICRGNIVFQQGKSLCTHFRGRMV